MLTSFGDAVQFAWRNVITQTVDLVICCPDSFVFWVDVDTSWVTHTHCIHFTTRTIEWVQANNTADTDFVVQIDLVFRLNVVWLAQSNVELAIISYTANAASVVV